MTVPVLRMVEMMVSVSIVSEKSVWLEMLLVGDGGYRR